MKKKKIFTKLLLDLKYYYEETIKVLLKDFDKIFKNKIFGNFDVETNNKVEGDERYLYDRLALSNEKRYFLIL